MPSRCFIAILSLLLVVVSEPRSPGQQSSLNATGSFKSYEFLLVNESVQKELKLSDEQILKVNEAVHDIRQKRRTQLEKLRNLPPPQGREKFLQILNANSEEALTSSSKVLKPDQVKRLKQIKVQQDGLDAFSQEAIITTLKLTKPQQEKIKKIDREANQKALNTPQVGTGGNYPRTLGNMQTGQKALLDRAVEVLTPEQKRTWQDLVGAPFDFMPQPRGPNQQKKAVDITKSP
jgi:hypothetical protein